MPLSGITGLAALSLGGALLIGIAAPPTASAQRASPTFQLRHEIPSAGTRVRLDLGLPQAQRRDYRWVGTAIGGIGLAIPAALAGRAYCGNSENGPRSCGGTTIGFGAGGFVIGGLVGHLVGRAIRRT
jgi:hypothetical protein